MHRGLKERAIALRKEGKTYREILAEIPVAKSTLSDWLKAVGLSVLQKQRITQARIDAALRGAAARKDARLREIDEARVQGRAAVGSLSDRELWLIGIALHWAEGTKQNARSPSAGISFINSDPRMLRVFLRWLRLLGVDDDALRFDVYLHEERKDDADQCRVWWSEQLGIGSIPIENLYLKKGNTRTKRVRTGDLYHGILRIKVKKSTSLNRQVEGWVVGICASASESGDYVRA